MSSAREFIKKLGLVRHPEGGYFKQTYESKDIVVAPKRFEGERHVATSI